MNPEFQKDGPNDYAIECAMLPAVKFNVAADLDPKDLEGIPVGGFENCLVLLPKTTFDASQAAASPSEVTLALSFHFCAVSTSLAQDVLAFLDTLNDYDQSLGGRGLSLDPSRSRGGDGWLTVVLRANERQGAPARFSQMAEQLGIPPTNGTHGTTETLADGGAIAGVISLIERHQRRENGTTGDGPRTPPDLAAARSRVQTYQVRFELGPDVI